MRALSVLYDETCGFCVSCARWLSQQRMLVELECLPAGSNLAVRRFPELHRSGTKEELVVVDDEGGVYRDTHAWLMVLWALEECQPYVTAGQGEALRQGALRYLLACGALALMLVLPALTAWRHSTTQKVEAPAPVRVAEARPAPAPTLARPTHALVAPRAPEAAPSRRVRS